MPLTTYRASRVLSVFRQGGSSPVLVETVAGRFVAKLRGAAQGLPPLIAEIAVAELAEALGLPVPERVLIELDADVPSDDHNDELADLLRRSAGANLGFRYLPGATDIGIDQLTLIDPESAALIIWLDGLTLNFDRSRRSPNILLWNGGPWLIDHGACLSFHYDWASVAEDTPREVGPQSSDHLLHGRARPLAVVDVAAAARLSRAVLRSALGCVPDAFLQLAFPGDDPARSREAYVAFLWKRLRAPRPFV